MSQPETLDIGHQATTTVHRCRLNAAKSINAPSNLAERVSSHYTSKQQEFSGVFPQLAARQLNRKN